MRFERSTEFEAFQAWRKSRMNFWQLLAEGLVPSFCVDLKELEEFDKETLPYRLTPPELYPIPHIGGGKDER